MHYAELSRTIDAAELGRRIRHARVAAGLTQSQLAGEDASAAYVSRIEAGQRRPEAGLLERMATRLDVGLEQLLGEESTPADAERRLEVDYAELSLASGDPASALERLDKVLADSSLGLGGDLERAARQARALALEALGRTSDAIQLLEDLVAEPRADASWLKALIALSRCHRESGDFARAIAVGEQAAAYIQELGLAGTTEAIQLTVTIAGAYMERGDLAHAMRMCQRAIDEAERVDSPVAKGSAYWNASVIESRRGSTVTALQLAEKAMALFELGDDSRNLGRLRTQVGFIQLRLDPPDPEGAKSTLQQAERELTWSSASALDRADHHLAVAKAHLMLGEHQEALTRVEEGEALIGGQSPMLQAEALVVRGQVSAARGDLAAARESYGGAIQVLAGLGVDRNIAQLWFDLAALLEDAGDSNAALDAYRRGAASTGLARPRFAATPAPS
ncbi:helix-turn-helix domain-containing protein [Marmoricola sp. URHB0036]|uniref:helix-turn-helix domain-containing protein n=1 Tax=Marmoricola sp. URHB0036 TaxID=1298863 RepID=UPI001E46BBB1|nr:helix-turn-helix domain-containing protein [Marmoricola sp. URHB0036]